MSLRGRFEAAPAPWAPWLRAPARPVRSLDDAAERNALFGVVNALGRVAVGVTRVLDALG